MNKQNKWLLATQNAFVTGHGQFVNAYVRDLTGISAKANLHGELHASNSSAAACLNVLHYLNNSQADLIPFFRAVGLNITKVIPFPTGVSYAGEEYDDAGPIVFEWVGPKKSPLNESVGARGKMKTSIDAYFLAEVDHKLTQIFIEWKFTEKYSNTHVFSGAQGLERMKRYAPILQTLIRDQNCPVLIGEGDRPLGLADFSYYPFYQMLRNTLLAKVTTPVEFKNGDETLRVEDYRYVHLSHSQNDDLNKLDPKHLQHAAGMLKYLQPTLHDTWMNILTDSERPKHIMGYWDQAINAIASSPEKDYLLKRYV